MLRTFLAVNDVSGLGDDDIDEALGRVARGSHDRGIRAIETFYALGAGRAYTYFEAGDIEEIVSVCREARVPLLEVVEARHMYTDLLDEPRRDR